MLRSGRIIRIAVPALTFVLCAPAALADPFTLLLLKMLRDQAVSASIEAGVNASQQPSPGPDSLFTPRSLPPAPIMSESQEIKTIIDESFLHLGPQQRAELHASLMGMLNDPKNLPARDAILTEFKAQAQALRETHRALSRLSESDMRAVAADARVEYEKLPGDQRRQLLQALQQGVPGMPRTLQDMMLAEFSSVPAAR